MQDRLKTVISSYIPCNMNRQDTADIDLRVDTQQEDGLKEGVSPPS